MLDFDLPFSEKGIIVVDPATIINNSTIPVNVTNTDPESWDTSATNSSYVNLPESQLVIETKFNFLYFAEFFYDKA